MAKRVPEFGAKDLFVEGLWACLQKAWLSNLSTFRSSAGSNAQLPQLRLPGFEPVN